MSPEQCEGRDKISAKADVASLGVMFYELLAGEPPFRADSSATLMRKHMIMEPPPIASKAQGVPPGCCAGSASHARERTGHRPSMQSWPQVLNIRSSRGRLGSHRGQRGLVIAGGIRSACTGLPGLRTRATKPPLWRHRCVRKVQPPLRHRLFNQRTRKKPPAAAI